MELECDLQLQDLEDLALRDSEVQTRTKRVGVVHRRLPLSKQTVENSEIAQPTEINGFYPGVPGIQKVAFKTWGCTHNISDGEYMAGLLSSYGYRIVDSLGEAELWVLNSCTVKSPSESQFKNEIKRAKEMGKRVVAAGCVSQGESKDAALEGISIVGVQQIDRIVEVVEETLKGNTVRLLGTKRQNGRRAGGASLSLPKIRRNPLIEIIPINTGCLNHCTYCKTKHARGQLGSYPPEEILARVVQAFQEGVKELWITSEDTGAYGRDIGTNLPDLLRQIVELIPPECFLRLGMTNPPYIMDHIDEIAEILRHPQVYSFIHIPVQSGSDPVLKEMRREYTRADFEKLVDSLRVSVPGLTVATDVICGFPTETEEDFRETMELCRKYRFPVLYINQFYPRPGTVAAKMKRIPTQVVKSRSSRLTELFQSYSTFQGMEGTEHEILITEMAHDKKSLVGHNKSYQQMLVPWEPGLMGKKVWVRVVETDKFHVKARLIQRQGKPWVDSAHVRTLCYALLFLLALTACVVQVN
ncbi:unnamed protein product [Cyprideis torosa]|uniref:tRNA-t(6)A37 methylthiotransferase n=1 Tax=Cyprideis torosa TaxID=163714 RepID=A0A7R8WLZ2_9CRUS|nr:unnamed protein product [Cyprideis torosa]CAG0898813.1 unnamed protein product [Cyprideis torosa]